MRIGSKTFDIDRHTYIMGILNVTPDSFSDGGRYHELDTALYHAEELIWDGVDILDIGGESTRPGYTKISVQEEIERVAPVIERLKAEFDIPISVDTYKSPVARAALKAGADMINDIWGLKYDSRMAAVIAEESAGVCLMHNRKDLQYRELMPDIAADLKESVKLAKAAGIADEKIILDPGIGFAKTYEMNLEVLKNLSFLTKSEYPLLLGTSRKSVIGETLDLPANEREEGTIVTTVMAVMAGYSFVRVHNVKANKRAIQMAEAILR